jgi:hypothetical protein
VNEELSGAKRNDAMYSNDVAYNYVKCVVHERIEGRSKAEEPKAGEERMHVFLRTTVEACNSAYINYINYNKWVTDSGERAE